MTLHHSVYGFVFLTVQYYLDREKLESSGESEGVMYMTFIHVVLNLNSPTLHNLDFECKALPLNTEYWRSHLDPSCQDCTSHTEQ